MKATGRVASKPNNTKSPRRLTPNGMTIATHPKIPAMVSLLLQRHRIRGSVYCTNGSLSSLFFENAGTSFFCQNRNLANGQMWPVLDISSLDILVNKSTV
jgi:hypothetical protein